MANGTPRSLFRSGHADSGATAIEYGLIAAFVAIAIIGGAMLAGDGIGFFFGQVGNTMENASSGSGN